MSAVLRKGLNLLWLTERYFSIFSLALCNVQSDIAFLMVFKRVTCLKFFLGPLGFPGYCRAFIFPLFIFRGSCVLNISLIIVATYSCISFGLYFKSSPGILSSPVALLLFSFLKLLEISSGVISFLNGLI